MNQAIAVGWKSKSRTVIDGIVRGSLGYKDNTIMVLKSLSVTYGRKLNLGDFNSVHSEVSLWALSSGCQASF